MAGHEGNNETTIKSIAAKAASAETLRSGLFPVHCECKLLNHFATENLDPPPLSYIGVSKFSCAACACVFSAWNETQPSQYFYRGSHGKWYSPWALPTKWTANPNSKVKNEQELMRAICREVSGNVARAASMYCQRQRLLSDSSATSAGGATESQETDLGSLFAELDKLFSQ